jgi:predicted transcriptional regulator
MSDSPPLDVLELTSQIVSAHVSNNSVAPDALPSLIQAVYRSLSTVGKVDAAPAALVPAVPIKKSVFPNYIICLEDGKKLMMLQRHLRVSFGMTPNEYRAKWKLPSDYPMTAPNYSIRRSVLAKETGLGRKPAAEPGVSVLPARRAKGSKG